jgi:CRISPR-associated protein Cas4
MYSAHSADAKRGAGVQAYETHIANVLRRAKSAAENAACFTAQDADVFLRTVSNAALFHDLGKLDPKNQAVLCGQAQKKKLPVQHTDAGTAYLLDNEHCALWSAVSVQSHHIGFPDFIDEQKKENDIFRDTAIKNDVDAELPELVRIHETLVSETPVFGNDEIKGDKSVFLRLALSCLADGDHTDTAIHYNEQSEPPPSIPLRPEERLEKLDDYVASLGGTDERSALRKQMYAVCKNAHITANIASCDSPVGSGKTTAVMAHLLRQASDRKLRRVFVVLPFTNIIQQSVQTYRKALVLDGENPADVVAELHHRADFESEEARHLSALWRAPIVVTTAVAFFETLASNSTAALRRLHELPGSAVFIDESHAALPAKLLPLAWKWMNVYANEWGCYWLLASGSLNRFWQIPEIGGESTPDVPELVDDDLREKLQRYETGRIEYKHDLSPRSAEELAHWIGEFPGPRLVIMNTVQSTAALADYFYQTYGRSSVEHLSTALAPFHRTQTLERVKQRLNNTSDTNWTFVATSCVEAGVDLSFRTGFRELGSLVSLLQASGRVNREGRYTGAEMWTFKIAEGGLLKANPGFKDAAEILNRYFERGENIAPALSTQSIRDELVHHGTTEAEFRKLTDSELQMRFPFVEDRFKVIDTNTRLTIVDDKLAEKIKRNEKVDWRDVQKNSVQIQYYKCAQYGSEEILPGLYQWNLLYNDFLGYMAGVLTTGKCTAGELEWGLTGKCDLVEMRIGADGKPVNINPVEFKRGKTKPNDVDRVQLCAQALCLEEMCGVHIERAQFYYLQEKRRSEAVIDAALREKTTALVTRIHAMNTSGKTPPPVYDKKKCGNCSLVDLCMPKNRKNAARYIAAQLKEHYAETA